MLTETVILVSLFIISQAYALTLSIANVYLWFSIVNALEKRDAANNEKTQK